MTVFEPPNASSSRRSLSRFVPHGRYDLETVDGGTRLTFRLDAGLSGLRKLLTGSPVQKTMDTEVKALENRKRVLEGGAL